MSGPGDGNGRNAEAGTERRPAQPETTPETAGVLANLPRTRPQRASPRRDAARRSAAAPLDDHGTANGNGRPARKAAAKASKSGSARTGGTARAGSTARNTGAATGAAKTKPRGKAAKARRADVGEVPRQGYESVEDRATGPVPPPGSTELLGTAAEIVSELAKAGVSSGERLLRDVFSRLGR